MLSRRFALYFTRILFFLAWFCSISIRSSGLFNFHTVVLQEDGFRTSIREDPIKMKVFEDEIVPWLSRFVSIQETSYLNLERINRIVQPTSMISSPFFRDSKLLFELTHLLIIKGFGDLANEIINFIRYNIHKFSAYATLLESLSFEDLTVFDHVLRLWFPRKIDKLALIQNLVDLRMGEDEVIEIIDIIWDSYRLNPSNDEGQSIDQCSRVLLSAMQRHYVSVFELLLERLSKLIPYISRRAGPKGNIIHLFCYNPDPVSLNQFAKVDEESTLSVWSDHRSRSYSSANLDLLRIMLRFGANINERNSNEMTPLHLAIILGNIEIVQVLLEYGADPGLPLKMKSAMELAQGSESVEQVLRNHLECMKSNKI